MSEQPTPASPTQNRTTSERHSLADPNPITDAFQRVQNFADDMREQGIHVGLGSNPVCVTCGERWPCAAETAGRT